MDKAQYKTERIEELGDLYRQHSTSKTEWDKCIAMECGDLPEKRGTTNGAVAIQMLLECRYTADDIDAELARLFPDKVNAGRARRMGQIFSKGKCRNVTVVIENGLLGLRWDRYKFFDQNGKWKGEVPTLSTLPATPTHHAVPATASSQSGFTAFDCSGPAPQVDLRKCLGARWPDVTAEDVSLWQEVRACGLCRDSPLVRDVTSSAKGFTTTRVNGYGLSIEMPLTSHRICLGKYIGLGCKGTAMFIGMNPGTNRRDGDKALCGDGRSAGGILQAMLAQITHDRDAFACFYFTDLVKCSTSSNELCYSEPSHKAIIDHCSRFLAREVAAVQPKVVVLLGKPVREAFPRVLLASGLVEATFELAEHTCADQEPRRVHLAGFAYDTLIFAIANTSRKHINFNLAGDVSVMKAILRQAVGSLVPAVA